MRRQDVGNSGQQMCCPRQHTCRHRKMSVYDLWFPAPAVPQGRKEARENVETHLQDGAGIWQTPPAGGAVNMDAVFHFHAAPPVQRGRLHADLVSAFDESLGNGLRHPTATSSDGRI